MQRKHRIAPIAVLSAVLLIALGATTVAAGQPARITGHVYVDNNRAGQNSISGFDSHPDGSLTSIPGSPFPTGGRGTGTPVPTQGALQFSADGAFVIAVDPGSDQISVLAVGTKGRLKLVSVTRSRGNVPGSIAVSGSLVYVANTGPGGSNYTGFRLDASGILHHIAGSTYALPDDAFPAAILFSPNGRHAAGIRTGGTPTAPTIGPSLIDSFSVGTDGRLTAAAGSPFASQGVGPIGAEFRPSDSSQLFVTNAHDGPGLGSVSVYDDTSASVLSPIDGSPFFNGQTATCWIDMSATGNRAFVVNTATPSLSSYTVAANGVMTLVGNTPFSNATAPFDVRLDPSGAHLYVVDAGAPKLHGFSVVNGVLTELAGSPFANPAAGAAFGIITN